MVCEPAGYDIRNRPILLLVDSILEVRVFPSLQPLHAQMIRNLEVFEGKGIWIWNLLELEICRVFLRSFKKLPLGFFGSAIGLSNGDGSVFFVSIPHVLFFGSGEAPIGANKNGIRIYR